MLKAARKKASTASSTSGISPARAAAAMIAALSGPACPDADAHAAALALLGVKPGDEELLLVPKHRENEAYMPTEELINRAVRKLKEEKRKGRGN